MSTLAYRQKNREELRKKQKDYYESNKEQCNKSSITWQKENKVKHNKYVKNWKGNNKDLVEFYGHKYLFGAPRLSILATCCGHCGGTSKLEIHHIDGRGSHKSRRTPENAPNNQPGNLMTLCKSCHQKHHKNRLTPPDRFDPVLDCLGQQ
jgi:hypothetical protein